MLEWMNQNPNMKKTKSKVFLHLQQLPFACIALCPHDSCCEPLPRRPAEELLPLASCHWPAEELLCLLLSAIVPGGNLGGILRGALILTLQRGTPIGGQEQARFESVM